MPCLTHLKDIKESNVPTTKLGTSTLCGLAGASARKAPVARANLFRLTSTASPRLGTVTSQYSGEAMAGKCGWERGEEERG
jgi:hypothetical protein